MSGKTALVTGANKGIGFGIAKGLGTLGWSVGVGARDDARRADAVRRLRTDGIDAFGVPLDVTDDTSVADSARLLRERGSLDVLVNNAGISGGPTQLATRLPIETIRAAVETNVFGVIRVTNALLPLLRESAHPRIVNMSSGVGSITLQQDPDAPTGPVSAAYAPSKSMLNAVTVQYAKELEGTGILVNVCCPGFVNTAINGFSGHRSPDEGAAIAVRLATLADDGPTGGFFHDDGAYPW
ncbi:SDR family NAD(P)-dependent oxidoreductase [Saccharopolyspora sp. NFXS83]|uniref:SDR family NAD(P)-dependent oxidoreductase n=1 Tax=Saccharopolyspora sp. NFXS83 TaxID=2993560 RepID=UPI00224AAB5A|nr:SDR family NAD(P)-dependent oxidoreductase [Saccharopolyspora sp. NFXS83]MCX2729921.1 SDR family NAD(P)-dependent oxidoreductase [Saccharopolyspora sp. NFXS83]